LSPLRILHLSDLHWSPSAATDIQIVVDALIVDLQVLTSEGLAPDLLIFSGDLAVGGDCPELIEKAWNAFITPVAAALGLPTGRVFVTPGNHDIARESVRAIPALESALSARLTSNSPVNAFIDGTATPNDETALALKRMENFYLVHDLNAAASITQTPMLRTFKVDVGGLQVGIACLNSAWRASGEAGDVDRGRLLVGERTIDRAAADLAGCDYRIAVHHHPLDWLTTDDRAAIDAALRRHFDIACTGHLHEAAPQKTTDARGSCVVSQAGSVFAGRKWFNGYNIIEVDLPTREHRIHVRTYVDDARRFDKATRVCPDGSVTFHPEGRPERRRIDTVELVLRENRADLRRKVAEQLNLIGADDVDPERLIRQFVVPPIVRRRHDVDDDDVHPDRFKTYNIGELLREPGNLLLIGERHMGKTSLAHFIAHEIACGHGQCDAIPVVIDLTHHKFNKYQLKKAIRSFIDVLPTGFDLEKALEEGLFVFIVDNLPTSGEDLQQFADHVMQSPGSRWIAMGTPNADGVAPDRLFNEHLGSFGKFSIGEFTRAGTRRTFNGDKRSCDSFTVCKVMVVILD
jgi:predicted MPP superfamily phosphohydrolase